jgi:hypothetical protein
MLAAGGGSGGAEALRLAALSERLAEHVTGGADLFISRAEDMGENIRGLAALERGQGKSPSIWSKGPRVGCDCGINL